MLHRDAWRLKTFDLLEMLRDRSKADGRGDDGTVRPALPHTARILAQLFTEIRASGAAPVLLDIPSNEELMERGPSYEGWAQRQGDELGAAFISPVAGFRRGMGDGTVRRTLRFPRHYIAAETELLARIIESALVRQHLLPATAPARR